MPKLVRTKKKCCRSTPRCKNCPVVWKRLEAAGLAERVDKRTWRRVRGKIAKPVMKMMRR